MKRALRKLCLVLSIAWWVVAHLGLIAGCVTRISQTESWWDAWLVMTAMAMPLQLAGYGLFIVGPGLLLLFLSREPDSERIAPSRTER